MKKIFALLIAISLIGISVTHEVKKTPLPTEETESITETATSEVEVEIEEPKEEVNSEVVASTPEVTYDSEINKTPITSNPSSFSVGGNSSGSSGGSSDGGSPHGYDFETGGDCEDWGTVCGTCGGPWDTQANRCWHCNP